MYDRRVRRLREWFEDYRLLVSVVAAVAVVGGVVFGTLGWAAGLVVALAIVVLLVVNVRWLASRLIPRVHLDCGDGAPFDDPAYGGAPSSSTHMVAVLNRLSHRDPLVFAKKIRVRSTGSPVGVRAVWLMDSPDGRPGELTWCGSEPSGPRSIHPADRHHYVLLTTADWPIGDYTIRLEVVRDDRQQPVSFIADVCVSHVAFPRVTLRDRANRRARP
jgi:hypothetical protein